MRTSLWNALLKDASTPRGVVEKVARLSRDLPLKERVARPPAPRGPCPLVTSLKGHEGPAGAKKACKMTWFFF